MLISDKQLSKFKALYLAQFSIELTDDEALEHANQLLGFIYQAYLPLNKAPSNRN